MASLPDCPAEILDKIYTEFGTEKKTLANVAIVSKRLNPAATKMLYAEIELNFTAVEAIWTSRLLGVLLRKQVIYQEYVTAVTVKGGNYVGEGQHLVKSKSLIEKIIRLLPNLQRFSWHAPQEITLPIVRALLDKTKVQALDVQFYDCSSRALNKKMLGELEGDTRIKASLLQLSAENLQDIDGNLGPLSAALRKAVIQAPELRSLVLRLSPSFVTDSQQPLVPMAPDGEDSRILPSLENLKIVGQTIELCQGVLGPIPHSHLRVLELCNCRDCSALLDSLSTHATELQLRVFKIIGSPEDVRLIWPRTRVIESCAAFIISFEGLEELVLGGYGGWEMACVAWHYRTLRKLTWHDAGLLSPKAKSRALKQIRDACKNLTSLRINNCRERLCTGHPVADTLATFSMLHDLTIVVRPLRPESLVLDDSQVWNMARSLVSDRLKWIEITDLAHQPNDPTTFVDVKHLAEIAPSTRSHPIHFHFDIGLGGDLHITNLLMSADSWNEKRVARLAKALAEEYVKPEDWHISRPTTRDTWVQGLYSVADSLQMEAVKAIGRRRQRKGNDVIPLIDTLGYGEM